MDHFGRDKSLLKEIHLTLKFLSCFELEGCYSGTGARERCPSGTGPTCCFPCQVQLLQFAISHGGNGGSHENSEPGCMNREHADIRPSPGLSQAYCHPLRLPMEQKAAH